MRAKCIANSGDKLSKTALEGGYTTYSQFHLKIGDVYTVYGVNVWRHSINYLTMNEAGSLPIWSPAGLFQLVDNRVPPNWYFVYLITDPLILNGVWGYRELTDQKHHDGLLGENKEALELFFERKKEIDKFHE